MTADIALVLGIIALAVFLFVTERLSVDTVAILTMVLLMATGILTPEEGFAGFSNPATVTVGAMFVISAAIFQTGALNNVGSILTRIGRRSYFLCLLAILLFSGVLSAFINDTAVVALMMPVVVQVSRDARINPSLLLMPLSFGALLGGVGTLIGTSTNILVSGIAQRQGEPPFSMFEMTPVGLVFMAVGILYLLLVGRFLLPDRPTGTSLTEVYHLGTYLTEVVLLPTSRSVGSAIQDAKLVQDLDIDIIQITRKNGEVVKAYPNSVLQAHDVLKVRCDVEKLKKLKDEEGGIELRLRTAEPNKMDGQAPKAGAGKMYEAIVTPHSALHGKSLSEINFRASYDGASVIAIRQRDQILHERLSHTTLSSGDVLLIDAEARQLPKLREGDDLLIISETERPSFSYRKVAGVLAIVAGVIGGAAFTAVPIILTATIGVVLVVLFNLISAEEAYKAIEWKVIFMLAGVLSMGAALEKTGAAALLSSLLIDSVGQWGPHALLSAFFFITFVSTNFMSNNATAALLAPIAIAAAHSMDVSVRPFLMAVTFAASFAFMTPMGYQTNTMIYVPGNYRFKDYLRVGTPLNLLLWLVGSLVIPYFFPF
ncbi:SLC13 family permease [soil metagenome]